MSISNKKMRKKKIFFFIELMILILFVIVVVGDSLLLRFFEYISYISSHSSSSSFWWSVVDNHKKANNNSFCKYNLENYSHHEKKILFYNGKRNREFFAVTGKKISNEQTNKQKKFLIYIHIITIIDGH